MKAEPNILTLIIGGIACLYGLSTIYFRLKKPQAFKKLEAMKKAMGTQLGSLIHFVAYTIGPILFGIVTIMQGLDGNSLF